MFSKPIKLNIPLTSIPRYLPILLGYKHQHTNNRCLFAKTFISFTVNPLHLHLAWPCVFICAHLTQHTLQISSAEEFGGQTSSLTRLSTLNYCPANLLKSLPSLRVRGRLDNLDCSHVEMALDRLLRVHLRGNWARLSLQDGLTLCQQTAKRSDWTEN